MKALSTLIRINRRELDQKRRERLERELHKEQLALAHQQLVEELEREQKAIMEDMALRVIYPAYQARNRAQQQRLMQEIDKMEQEIALLAEQIIDLFIEVKTFETLLEQRFKKLRLEEAKRETLRLDEIALQQFIQAKEEG